MPENTVAEVVELVQSEGDKIRQRLIEKRKALEEQRVEREQLETVAAEVQTIERLVDEEARLDAELAYELRAKHIQEQGRKQREARERGEDYEVQPFPDDVVTPPDNAAVSAEDTQTAPVDNTIADADLEEVAEPVEQSVPTPPSLSSILQPSLFDSIKQSDDEAADKSDTEE